MRHTFDRLVRFLGFVFSRFRPVRAARWPRWRRRARPRCRSRSRSRFRTAPYPPVHATLLPDAASCSFGKPA